MRARAIREGSVGLLILIAVGLFGGLVLWLRGLNPGRQTYRATIVFDNTLGMQEGTSVRYRGVPVGQVLSIVPTANAVDVAVEIGSSELRIPRDAVVMVNQSGLIGDATIDITPQRLLSEQELAVDPTGESCLGQTVICDGDRLSGQVGASYDSLIRSAEGLANAFADPELIADLKTTLDNATTLTESANLLSTELIVLSRQLQTELGPLAASANRATNNVSSAAAQFEITGAEVNRLVVTNRGTLVNTLTNLDRSAAEIQAITTTLSPALRQGEFIANLERLSADAAVAAADIRSITGTFNSAENLVMLQQTLDSARSVFQSAHKVMADVDELTGDPVLRRNLRDLINGLSGLVSLTNQLEQASQVAGSLTPAAGAQVERVTFTPIPAPPPPTGAGPTPVTITHQGQTYRLDVHSIQPR
ncbi:MlaD family protein [Phormidium tenue]|uniref:Mammalian cell entry protein n=1 Tax=Phormidium tenue NIES-30 TaxID=549789 RepID=A0A1U7J7F6_9CYAN|nr:MlaD family protein [Phormidium tenue]MBD2231576.1 MCE family protein [Phormidium tenue FACHB-1052]OKH49042.1 mammalian cell entry protein [Phormidium tenue NIES-30]